VHSSILFWDEYSFSIFGGTHDLHYIVYRSVCQTGCPVQAGGIVIVSNTWFKKGAYLSNTHLPFFVPFPLQMSNHGVPGKCCVVSTTFCSLLTKCNNEPFDTALMPAEAICGRSALISATSRHCDGGLGLSISDKRHKFFGSSHGKMKELGLWMVKKNRGWLSILYVVL
jgi:hypothetical protein